MSAYEAKENSNNKSVNLIKLNKRGSNYNEEEANTTDDDKSRKKEENGINELKRRTLKNIVPTKFLEKGKQDEIKHKGVARASNSMKERKN